MVNNSEYISRRKASAEEKLADLLPAALDALKDILLDWDVPRKERMQAISIILDRTLGPAAKRKGAKQPEQAAEE